MNIHPTAIIGKEVEIGSNVSIGPFSVIEGRTRIGSGTKIESYVSIGSPSGIVEIGEDNHIMSNAMLGGPPQDLSYKGEPTKFKMGNKNIIREFATLNCGTTKGGGVTRLGNQNMIMSYVHVAHDCNIGNSVVVANLTQFAGHVEIGDFARIGGVCAVIQFGRIGRFAYVGGGSHINKDILPFSIAEGKWARARATNKVGLERAGFSKEDIDDIYRAIKAIVMGNRTIDEALEKIGKECSQSENIKHLVEFIKTSKTGVAR